MKATLIKCEKQQDCLESFTRYRLVYGYIDDKGESRHILTEQNDIEKIPTTIEFTLSGDIVTTGDFDQLKTAK
jgi:hypothetical protein